MNQLLISINWAKYWLHLLALTISLVLWCFCFWLYWHEQNRFIQAELAVAQQKSVNEAAENSVIQLKNYHNQYKLLKQQGLVGPPPRLEWAEILLEKYQYYQIPGLYFVISPTKISKPEDNFFTSDLVEIKRTPMQISFNLLHEGDFYRYMQALHQHARGQFSVQECTINRDLNQDAEATDFIISFKGQCDILWFSMKDITATCPEGIVL